MNPKVSVIMPVYNVAAYLKQCMNSVVNQTLRDIEIICVDDGSTDGSLDILRAYAQQDNRVRVLQQENAGAGAARNRGMLVATGDYLSILDADDFFEPEMLEKAYNKATENDAQIVVFRSDQYRMDLDTLVSVSWTLREKELPPYRPMDRYTFTGNVFKVFVGWSWDKLFERKFVEQNALRFQEIRTSNDMLFVFTAICVAQRIEIVDEVLAHQRRNNPESLSNTREKSWDNFYRALTALKQALIERGIFWEVEQDYINYALHFSLWHFNTITGEKKQLLHDKLKNEWFDEFGIADKEECYFYNKKEYRNYLDICES